jgi:hypothetical protein
MGIYINRTAKLAGKLLADGSKATLDFFKHEFPNHVKNKQPEALALLSVMGHEALQVAEGVIEKNPAKVLGVVPQFIGAKWAYMGYEYKGSLAKGLTAATKKENHPFIKDAASIIKTDFSNYIKGHPSLMEGYVEGKGIHVGQYANHLITEFAPTAQRAYASLPQKTLDSNTMEKITNHPNVKDYLSDTKARENAFKFVREHAGVA